MRGVPVLFTLLIASAASALPAKPTIDRVRREVRIPATVQPHAMSRRKGMKISDLAQRISSYPSLADGMLGKRIAKWSQ